MEAEKDLQALNAMKVAEAPQDDLIRLSTGVILRGRAAPPLILMAVIAAYPRPKPPTWSNPAFGGREMENAEDPDYIDRVKSWQSDQTNVMMVALIMSGTELVSKPKGMPGPEEDKWLEEYTLLDLPTHPGNKSWRYLRWVQYKAAVTADDMNKIMEVVGRLSGIPNSAVKTAENFPGSDKNAGGAGGTGH